MKTKRYGCIVLITLSFCVLNAQNKTIDTTYRPKTYNVQVRQFKSYPDNPNDIVFLGNSITARAHWNELLGLPDARNRGISGDTTFGVLERLDEITEGKPEKIFMLIGINDISRNFPDSVILGNYEKIIQHIQSKSPHTKLFVETILPVNSNFKAYERHYHKDNHILEVNKGIKELADKYSVTLIDLYPLFLDNEARLDAKYTDEGLHLNEIGYLHWKKILQPYLAN
ncbi:GDSL-type esterase/lipase family protein [Galbibacter pacificus]|uniref:GDSL-type esterase/lipase family protein n=1 Tax=Galbibacter pacificus TaxID=2996052 RepID=A0ABT6FMU8_9FLAO|nr:GDSL-type esterase/lipase family protein [Galbibacter pacificus]MDG3581116.1 GDSL-type esterase/lipase family protein [Galbibacter pacificus]MDG3584594.1 GDSL-type esterase/lipase family protein [Galbibacter pacificus]